jgi:hypothetical protein
MYDSLVIAICERSSRIAITVFRSFKKIELYKVFRVENCNKIHFNPSKKHSILLHNTTIPHIIKEYSPKFAEQIKFASFKYTNKSVKTPCFSTYHTGSIIQLVSGSNIATSFITSKPQGSINPLFTYKYNNIKSYDVSSNLIMVKGDWKIEKPKYNKNDDFREFFDENEFFLKNNFLHVLFNNDFMKFDYNSKTCLVKSTDNELCEYDIIYEFRKDVFSDRANKDFVLYSKGNIKTLNDYLTDKFNLTNACIASTETTNSIIKSDTNNIDNINDLF